MATYLYRQGNGNEGNYPQFFVTLADDVNPWHAIHALMVNRYIPNTKTRSHVMRNAHTEGEEQHGILGTVYEGPRGEQAFDSAWLTAELEPATDDDVQRSSLQHYASLQDAIDVHAMRFYRKLLADDVHQRTSMLNATNQE